MNTNMLKPSWSSYGLDFETFGTRDLPTVGLENYLADPEFRPLLAAVAWGDKPRDMIFDFVCDPFAKDNFEKFLRDSTGPAIAHNAAFERGVIERSFSEKPTSWRDSAVVARRAGGGSKLEDAGLQLLDSQKLEVGKRLIKKFSVGENAPTPEQVSNDPDWELFKEYCVQDARISYELVVAHHRATNLEHEFEALTYEMNQIGWPVDVLLVEEMQRRYLKNQEQALQDFQRYFDPLGELNINSLQQLKKWCAARGIKAKSFDKDSVAAMIRAIEKKLDTDALSREQINGYDEVLKLLRLKQTLGGSSLKKLKVILDKVGEDGRLRDQYLHCGASQTWRTTGVGVQMQNLKQLGPFPDDVEELNDPSIHWSNDKMADNLRQCFTASDPNGVLIVGDFSAVESRGLAYLAEEEWKLNAYWDGLDIYKVLAQKIFGIRDYDSITKSSPERKAGKVGELSCGYGAGIGAVLSMAKNLSIDMTETQAKQLVVDWREVNPKTVALWYELEQLLQQAFDQREVAYSDRWLDGNYRIFVEPAWTPSSLIMMHPGVMSLMIGLLCKDGRIYFSRIFHGCHRRGRNFCYYKAKAVNGKYWSSEYRDPTTKQIRRYELYGGKLAGIMTQSFCRELFFRSMNNLKHALSGSGVDLIGQFHDEIVVDWNPTKANISQQEASAIMKYWMSDAGNFTSFPLEAEIKSAYRYIK